MSATRLQDEYNKAITDCDVFVSLFKTKVGQYTEEEFLKALETFKLNNKLLIYTYFNDSQISISQITHEISSLLNFKNRLAELGHFYKSYKDVEQLKYLFDQQLNKFIPKLTENIKVDSQREKKESEQLLQSQIWQLEKELKKERLHNQKLAKSPQSQIESKESEIVRLQNIAKSQQEQNEELIKKLEDQERSQNQKLVELHQSQIRSKDSEITRLLEEKSKLKQQLVQEQDRFTKQQANLQAAQAKIAEQESEIYRLQRQIEQLQSEPKTIAKDKVELKSEKGVDYSKLRDLLATGEWKKADQETDNVMLQVTDRKNEEWLREEDIDNFPCVDLRTINQLWLHYSDGKFGFSIQKEIYESLGGTRGYVNYDIWISFCDRVGWKKGGDWLDYDELTFTIVAPRGHLPAAIDSNVPVRTLTQSFGYATLNAAHSSCILDRAKNCDL